MNTPISFIVERANVKNCGSSRNYNSSTDRAGYGGMFGGNQNTNSRNHDTPETTNFPQQKFEYMQTDSSANRYGNHSRANKKYSNKRSGAATSRKNGDDASDE